MNCAKFLPLTLGLAFLFFGGYHARGEDFSAELEKGKTLLNQQKAVEAMAVFKAVVKKATAAFEKDPKDAGAAYGLGRAYFYMEHDDKALKAFELAADLDPKNGEIRFFCGLIHMYGRRYVEAEREFLAATESNPKAVKYWLELGRALGAQKKAEPALAAFRKALALEPASTPALYNAGNVLAGMKKHKEALQLYLKVLEKEAGNLDVLYNTGQTEQILGKHKDSLEHFLEVTRLCPTDWRACCKVIQCYQALGKIKKRDTERARLLRLRAGKKVKNLNKARSYVRDQFAESGKWIMALEHFELVGERAKKYAFIVQGLKSRKQEYIISLGSYETTHQIAKETGLVEEGDRYFHLDGYFPGNVHTTYFFFNKEPSYDVVREKVLLILRGKLKAASGSRPGK